MELLVAMSPDEVSLQRMGPNSVQLRNGERKNSPGQLVSHWSEPSLKSASVPFLVPICTLVGENDVSFWLEEDGSTGLPHTASTCLP